LGVRLLNDDHLFALHGLRFNFHLLVRFQIALFLGLLAHALHRVHDVALLREESVAQVGGPLNIIGEPLHNIGKRRHGLNTGIPGLFRHRVHQGLVFQILVLSQPLLKLDEFQRVSRSRQNLGEEWIRIKRNRRHQRIKLIGWNFRRSLVSRGSRLVPLAGTPPERPSYSYQGECQKQACGLP
jgi:hypothetical protein